MTKEPSKDFRQAVQDEVRRVVLDGVDSYEATTRILALCKEMLVPEAKKPPFTQVSVAWNACRAELLKQLGGQDNGGC